MTALLKQQRFKQTGAGAVSRMALEKMREVFSVADMIGVDPTGATDSTAGLIAAFSRGGDIEVPEGHYLIAGAGADAGGVVVTLTKNTRVRCHAKARFFTDNLDNDMILFQVPADGVGVPESGIDFEWFGGFIDQRNQRNSTVIPFKTDFPGAKPGASATCDGLSVRGDYIKDGKEVSAINRLRIIGVETNAGDHWQSAGGDSGIFAIGYKIGEVDYNLCRGARDCGIYLSGASVNGMVSGSTTANTNHFVNCFHGIGPKRSLRNTNLIGNTFDGCVRGVAYDRLAGNGNRGGIMTGNTFIRCHVPFSMVVCFDMQVWGNTAYSTGAYLEDGTTVFPLFSPRCIVLEGSQNNQIGHNLGAGMDAAFRAAFPTGCEFIHALSVVVTSGDLAGTVQSSGNTFVRNMSDGFRAAGKVDGSPTGNTALENYNSGGVSTGFTSLGSNGRETRLDASNRMAFASQTYFFDGSAATPIICRNGQTDVGMYFGTGIVGLSAGGQARVVAGPSGVGFNGATPTARQTYATADGSAVRGVAWHTDTVTTAQLAQRVKALIDDLKTCGLLG